MENKITRFFKVTAATLAILMLGAFGGIATTIGAQAQDKIATVEAEDDQAIDELSNEDVQ